MVSIILFLHTNCTNRIKILEKDDQYRHALVDFCPQNLDKCQASYDSIVFKTNRDLLIYLEGVYFGENENIFIRLVEDSLLTKNKFLFLSNFDFLDTNRNELSRLVLGQITNHNQSYLLTLNQKADVNCLLKMAEEDQNIRKELIKEIEANGMTSKFMELNSKMGDLDKKNERILKGLTSWKNLHSHNIIYDIGNIGIKCIFYIVQHSEDKQNMKWLLKCRYLEPFDRFRLIDRMRLNEGKNQLYGTHSDQNNNILPIRDIKRANMIRMKNGLPSIKNSLDQL